MDVGRIAEHVDDFEGGGLLALDAHRVDGVHKCDRVVVGQAPGQCQTVVEISSTWRIFAPWTSAWPILPSAILPCGTSTAQTMPARTA